VLATLSSAPANPRRSQPERPSVTCAAARSRKRHGATAVAALRGGMLLPTSHVVNVTAQEDPAHRPTQRGAHPCHVGSCRSRTHQCVADRRCASADGGAVVPRFWGCGVSTCGRRSVPASSPAISCCRSATI